jgi:4-diphosphocytidyl-2-C-methyl-D-erythritol kinase
LTFALPAHAKLNLGLRVLGRRPDGYHEVETTLQAISLHDLLLVTPSEQTSLELEGEEAPVGEANLVLQAARALEAASGRSLPASFRLLKRIPAGAGFGGASSDAAAALRALQRLHGLTGIDLEQVGARIGSDVPFFLRGGSALATGRGEKLAPQLPATGWFALAWPGWMLSTGAVYAAWRPGAEGPNQLRAAADGVEPRLAGFAAALGAGWQMTGSGSAFFRRCLNRAEAEQAVASVGGWTAVAQAVGAWA